jgi:hypothetical protein
MHKLFGIYILSILSFSYTIYISAYFRRGTGVLNAFIFCFQQVADSLSLYFVSKTSNIEASYFNTFICGVIIIMPILIVFCFIRK